MPKQMHNRLVEAMTNHNPPCDSTHEFNPEKAELVGVIPGPARGLLALKHELADEIEDLIHQIAYAKSTIEAAECMAEQIIQRDYPDLRHRKGYVVGEDWTFMAHGPHGRRRFEAEDAKKVQRVIAEEARRHEFGDDAADEMADHVTFPEPLRRMFEGMGTGHT